jgi:hypothetical protein
MGDPFAFHEPRKLIAIRLNAKVSGRHRSGEGRVRFRDPSNGLNEAKRLNGWNDLNAH